MKKAIFSNGFVDVYKGKRDIKAAWMITKLDSGEVVCSGHSLDRQKAAKTAATNIPTVANMPSGGRSMLNSVHMHVYAKKRGYSSAQEMAEDYKRQNANHALQYKIEVVDILAS